MKKMTKQDLLKTPPIPCDLAVGDKVTYTNSCGVIWPDMVVIGFSDDQILMKYGSFIHTDFLSTSEHNGSAWWSPKKRGSLEKV